MKPKITVREFPQKNLNKSVFLILINGVLIETLVGTMKDCTNVTDAILRSLLAIDKEATIEHQLPVYEESTASCLMNRGDK